MATQIDIRNFPALAELQSKQQWVLWCYEEKDGKKTKVPYNAHTGGQASTTNQKTWSSYRHVCSQLAKGHTWDKRPYDGIGFVFANGYAGIDFDHCRDLETGEINDLTSRRIASLASYSEISPSGTGVHTIVRGSLPTGVKRPEIEMYSRARFFTMTGNHLPGSPTTIEDRQEQITTLYEEVAPKTLEKKKRQPAKASPYDQLATNDTALLEVARRAKNGARFDALWRGDWGSYASQSQADQALCNMLAFYTGNDAARIDSLFRQSGLYREKWDREDYRDRTIGHAIDITVDTYRSFKDAGEEAEEEEWTPPPEPPTDHSAILEENARLREHYQALRERYRSVREELRVYTKVESIPASIASVSQKATYKALYRAIANREPDTDDGFYKAEPWRCGIQQGQSSQTARDNITDMAERLGIIEKELVRVEDDKAPLGFRQETYIRPTENFLPERWRVFEDEQRKHGGSQICSVCKQEIKAKTYIIATQLLHTCGCGTRVFAVEPKEKPFAVGFFNLAGEPVQSQVDITEEPQPIEVQSQLDQVVTHTSLHSQVDNADLHPVPQPMQSQLDFAPDLSHLPEEIQTLCSEHNLTPAEPCSACGCPLHNRLDECARCYPVKSKPANIPYAEYGSEIIDRVYPRNHTIQSVQFGGNSHAA